MARGQSYNELVAMGRTRLVEAAKIVALAERSEVDGKGRRTYSHTGCCAAMDVADVPSLGKAHFKRVFANGYVYYWGFPYGLKSYSTNHRQCWTRVNALLLAAASLE
jgi:hypothetical protein